MKFVQFLFILLLLIFVIFLANDPLLFHFLTTLNPIHWILFAVMGIYFYKNELDLHLYGFLIMFYVFFHSSLFYQLVDNYPQYFAWLPDNVKNPPIIDADADGRSNKSKKRNKKKVTFISDNDSDAVSDADTESIYQDTEQERDDDSASQVDHSEDIQKIHQILYESYGANGADGNDVADDGSNRVESTGHENAGMPMPPQQDPLHVQGIDLPKYNGNALDLMEQGDNRIIQQFKTSMTPAVSMSVNEIENFRPN